MVSLTEALTIGCSEDFIRQPEQSGVGPISEADFMSTPAKVIKHEQSGGRTSRAQGDDKKGSILVARHALKT